MENTIIFAGDTGVGKTFVCNKIFDICNSQTRFDSETSLTATQGQICFEGKPFSVLECPGFFCSNEHSSPEKISRSDPENLCRLVRTLEDCKDVCCVVFVFGGRFGIPQRTWYNRIRDLVGYDNWKQIIVMQNKQAAEMTESELTRNKTSLQKFLELDEQSVPYFPIIFAPKAGQDADMSQVNGQLRGFLSNVSKFVPFNLKNMKIPEICYEKEVVEGPFERVLAEYRVGKSNLHPNTCGNSVCVTKIPSSENPLMSLIGGKEKGPVYVRCNEEESVHVPYEGITRVVGKFQRTYKIRFEGTRDLVKEELLEERVEKY